MGLAMEEQSDNRGGIGGVYVAFGVAERHQNEDGSIWVGLALGKISRLSMLNPLDRICVSQAGTRRVAL